MAARTIHVSIGTHWMSAAHIASDDFEVDMHLDSAGDSFGATAQGGSRRRILGVGKRRGLFRASEDEGPEVLYRPLI